MPHLHCWHTNRSTPCAASLVAYFGAVLSHPQAVMAHLHRAKAASGKLLTAELRRIRDYKNPDFLEKMVAFHRIRDAGSNFPPDVFDPAGFPKEDYYDECALPWPPAAFSLA